LHPAPRRAGASQRCISHQRLQRGDHGQNHRRYITAIEIGSVVASRSYSGDQSTLYAATARRKRHRGLIAISVACDMLRKPVLEKAGCDVIVFGWDDPSTPRPDHQKAGQLVGPDQARRPASVRRATRNRGAPTSGNRRQRRLVESARERAKHGIFLRRGGTAVASRCCLRSGWSRCVRSKRAIALRVPCPISIRTWPVRSPDRLAEALEVGLITSHAGCLERVCELALRQDLVVLRLAVVWTAPSANASLSVERLHAVSFTTMSPV